MRLLKCGMIILAAGVFGCSQPNGSEEFYERHPEYNQRPGYFDKSPGYDDQPLNDRYSGDKEE